MGEKAKYLFKNMGILTISNFASKILVFLLVPLYTSVLSTAEYGTYDLVVSTISLLYPILTVNIFDAVMRYCMDDTYSKKEIAIIGSKKVLISIGLCGVGLVFIFTLKLLPQLDGLYVFIFLYYAFYVVNQLMVQFAKGLEKVSLLGIAGVIGTVVMLGCNVLFLLVFKMGLEGFFLANILSQAIPALFYFFQLKFWNYVTNIKSNRELEKKLLVYCLPLLFTTLGWWINNVADRYAVTAICGVAANGVLSVAYKIPSIINTLQVIFTQAWQISAIKEYGEKDTARFYGRTFVCLNLFMSVACAGLIILSKPLAYILYANEFFEAWKYVPMLMISTVINCASGFIGPILGAKKDSKSMATSSIYGAVVNIVLNVVLVYLIGIQGATIATVVSSYVIYHFRLRAVKNDIRVEQYWKTLLIWGLLVLESIITVYSHNWMIETAIGLIIILINMNTIKLLLNMFIGFLKRKSND